MQTLRQMALHSLRQYLAKRIKAITSRAPSEISGSIALIKRDNWEEELEGHIENTIMILLNKLTAAKGAGKTPLTSLAIQIGRKIMQIDDEEYTENVFVAVGDLMLEALYITGYITLKRAGGPKSEAPIEAVALEPLKMLLPDLSNVETVPLDSTTPYKPAYTDRMVRTIGKTKSPVIKRRSKNDELDLEMPWVKALDKMQRTPWKINERVLAAVITNTYLFTSYTDNQTESLKSKAAAHQVIVAKASKAMQFDRFYQGLNTDYRGRFYTIENSLEYQGEDTARGMFLFYEGKVLTDAGKRWLGIHTATSYNETFKIDEIPEWCTADYRAHLLSEGLEDISVDKMTLDDQYIWTEENWERITESGKNGEFWVHESGKKEGELAAEKPVAFLAACIECYDYSISDFDDEFITHLPIPIDAHSSGWQHLAAMTLDEQTGKYVGLIGSDIPIDFYISVAKGVIEQAKTEKNEEVIAFLQKLPMKVIRKCITKRSSMILAYSAGPKTLAETIVADSFNEGLHVPLPLAKEIAKLVINTILEICPGPLLTMKFMQELASYEIGEYARMKDGKDCTKEFTNLKARRQSLFDKSNNRHLTEDELQRMSVMTEQLTHYETERVKGNGAKTLSWTTYSGFDVEYENFYEFDKTIRGYVHGYGQSGFINHTIKMNGDNPSKRKFLSGISPNIVHSMDAAQLALTCISFDGAFAGIHDSYSTHASDVDELLHVSKHVFIDMYEDGEYLTELRQQILTTEHSGLPDDEGFQGEQPELGNLNMEHIHKSDGFFS